MGRNSLTIREKVILPSYIPNYKGTDDLLIHSVTFDVKGVLDNLSPQGCFGGLILRNYQPWLRQRQPSRYCDSQMAEHWREYQFKRTVNYLDYISKIMLDKPEN